MQDVINDFRTAMFSGDYDQAERFATSQIAEHGESPLWLNELGQLHLAQGRFAEALQYFDRAVCLDPQFVEGLLNGAIVLSDLGFYDEAAKRFEAARQVDAVAGTDASAHLESTPPVQSVSRRIASKYVDIADLYLCFNDNEKAFAELTRALSLVEFPALRLHRAKLMMRAGKPEDALKELEDLRRVDPKNPQVHVLAAQCYMLLEKLVEAREALSRAELLEDRSRTGEILRRAALGELSN